MIGTPVTSRCAMLNLDFKSIPTLETERLRLRPILDTDRAAVMAIRSDRRTMAHIPTPLATSLGDAEEHIAKIHADQRDGKMLAWAITLRPSTDLIGIICLLRMKKEHFRTELGYALVRPYWGQGIMSEAVDVVVRHAFDTLGFHSIEAGVGPENMGSIRVLERNGFIQEGHLKEDTYQNGAFTDTLLFGRTDSTSRVDQGRTEVVKEECKKNSLIADQWFAAFNTHDLDKLLALYADDARHYSPKLKVRRPETKGYIVGKEALRHWWRDAFDRLPSLRYERTYWLADEEAVFMEYIRHVEGEDDMIVGELLEVRDGLIIASRVYHG